MYYVTSIMKLVLGSPDRYLQPIKLSLGEVEVSPQTREEVLGRFNTFPKLDFQRGEPRARVKDETEAAAGASAAEETPHLLKCLHRYAAGSYA